MSFSSKPTPHRILSRYNKSSLLRNLRTRIIQGQLKLSSFNHVTDLWGECEVFPKTKFSVAGDIVYHYFLQQDYSPYFRLFESECFSPDALQYIASHLKALGIHPPDGGVEVSDIARTLYGLSPNEAQLLFLEPSDPVWVVQVANWLAKNSPVRYPAPNTPEGFGSDGIFPDYQVAASGYFATAEKDYCVGLLFEPIEGSKLDFWNQEHMLSFMHQVVQDNYRPEVTPFPRQQDRLKDFKVELTRLPDFR